mmetsp:Transcript_14068/g.21931  ORF Transcript_14068/g.21931 Transcript_14068/m.21931 type:complete len:213 (+) Transcript_14068:2924-3562(+)
MAPIPEVNTQAKAAEKSDESLSEEDFPSDASPKIDIGVLKGRMNNQQVFNIHNIEEVLQPNAESSGNKENEDEEVKIPEVQTKQKKQITAVLDEIDEVQNPPKKRRGSKKKKKKSSKVKALVIDSDLPSRPLPAERQFTEVPPGNSTMSSKPPEAARQFTEKPSSSETKKQQQLSLGSEMAPHFGAQSQMFESLKKDPEEEEGEGESKRLPS